jgi:hypothetical protein
MKIDSLRQGFLSFLGFSIVLMIMVYIYSENGLLLDPALKVAFKNRPSDVRTSITSGQNESEYLINFLETDFGREFFSARQMCSIESTAVNNPHARVQVYSVRAKFPNSSGGLNLSQLYSNVRLIDLNLNPLFNGTPLDQWWTDRKVNASPYTVVHTSDAARLALLWKTGGIYSDIDFLNIKSYANLVQYSNGLNYYFNRAHMFNNAFFLFKARSSYLWYLMQRFAQGYDPSQWSGNGPNLVISTIKEFCELEDPFANVSSNQTNRLVSYGRKCDDIFVFPQSYLSPIDWDDAKLKDFFETFVDEKSFWQDDEHIKQAYAIHLYNKISCWFKLNVSVASAYIQIAQKMCPNNFKYVSNSKIEF